jgi:hypothetical protein
MAKLPHTSAEMRAFYPVFRWQELAAGYRYRHWFSVMGTVLPFEIITYAI